MKTRPSEHLGHVWCGKCTVGAIWFVPGRLWICPTAKAVAPALPSPSPTPTTGQGEESPGDLPHPLAKPMASQIAP